MSAVRRLRSLLWRARSPWYLRPSLLDERWLPAAARERIEALLRARPLVVLDLGARGGVHELGEPKGLMRIFGFEPNEAECKPLQLEWRTSGYLEARFLPVAVAGEAGTGRLVITRAPGASSFLEPDPETLRPFGPRAELFEPVAVEEVPTTTLDRFAAEEQLSYVDLVKIDTEGSELEVIRGGRRLLGESTLAVKTEIVFRPFRRGQPLFRDIDDALRELGFLPLSVEPAAYPVTWCRASVPPGVGDRGETLWGDAVYVKDVLADPSRLDGDDAVQPLRFLLLLESLGFVGYALEAAQLFREHGAAERGLVDALEGAILERHRVRRYQRLPLPGRVVRRLVGRLPYR